MQQALHPDTEAVLLLCGWFGRPRRPEIQPLEPREFNRLDEWLRSHALRPANLVRIGDHEPPKSDPPIAAPRLTALLSRGGALALALEVWDSKGLWVVSRYDESYPIRLRVLGAQTPPLLYGVGPQKLLVQDSAALAVVGSREVDESGITFTQDIARTCAEEGVTVVSGAARGVDSEAMYAALQANGTVIGVLADNLARAAVAGKNRAALLEERLVLVTPYDPSSGFSVGNAMGRNKLIYAFADAALVVATGRSSGGTWAGAVEQLKRNTTPVFTRLEEPIADGNVALLDEGARPFPARPWPDMRTLLTELADPATSFDEQLTQPPLL